MMNGRRGWMLLAAAVAAIACWCGGLMVAGLVGAVSESAAQNAGLVDCQGVLAAGDPAAVGRLDSEQLGNAQVIVEVGIGMGTPPRAWVIAIATAMQESGLRNLTYGDRDSLGLFQQRPSMGWGTPEQILDPVYASTAFYRRLLQVEGWQQLPLTVAAQAVQRSAFPDAYARHEPIAVAVVEAIAGEGAADAAFIGDARCALSEEVSAAGWTRPVAGPVWSGFRTASRPDHYGIDFGAPSGTVIRAAAAGVVSVVTCNASSNGRPFSCDVPGSPSVQGCGWYVDIRHGDVVTRYCHMLSRPQVEVGEQVAAGQPIGLVGSSGNSSGPHLHFEVLLQYPDGSRAQTDPIPFLAARGVAVECDGAPADCQSVHGDRVRQ